MLMRIGLIQTLTYVHDIMAASPNKVLSPSCHFDLLMQPCTAGKPLLVPHCLTLLTSALSNKRGLSVTLESQALLWHILLAQLKLLTS